MHDMYSRFDDVFNAPFGYTIPRDRVVVIPDSAYKAAQERQNAQRVARLEARRAEHLSVVDQLEKQIAELQPVLQEVDPYTEFAATKELSLGGCWRSAGRLLVVDSFCSHTCLLYTSDAADE